MQTIPQGSQTALLFDMDEGWPTMGLPEAHMIFG